MDTSVLTSVSDALADIVASAAPAVVQVQGARRPASGVVHSDGVVVTTASALGRGDSFRVRRADGATLDAELAGWDPTTSLAVLKVNGLGIPPLSPGAGPARVGHLAVAIARSWSNAVTASNGIIAIIGGPLRTGRRREIAEVIRTTARMHDGFAGGALLDVRGGLIGITTAASIRGLGVVIPSGIAWTTATALLEHGGLKRGYLGLAGQPVQLGEGQRESGRPEEALLVVAVTKGGPAESAGILVGDILTEFDGHAVGSPEELLDLLVAERIGRALPIRALRGKTVMEVNIAVGERSR